MRVYSQPFLAIDTQGECPSPERVAQLVILRHRVDMADGQAQKMEWYVDDIVSDTNRSDVSLLVATGEDGRAVGAVRLQYDASGCRVSYLSVVPTAPRKTAERIMQCVAQAVIDRGVQSLYLTCSEQNPAHKTYEAIGFTRLATTYKATANAVLVSAKERERWAV